MIWSLDNVAAQDAAVTGGKANALARLIGAGFPVPDGFVVTTMEDAGPDMAVRLDPAALYAVRSSGYSEDSANASFAGQYESVLGVRGLDEVSNAIRRCFASFSNSRSAAYREARNSGNRGGAVIVQRLVEAEAAGVAFTIDPVTGAGDGVLIESNFGLGESVVGGHVNPDGFIVRKDTGEILERRIGDKRMKSALDSNGTRLEPVPDSASRQPSLTDEAILAVATLARRVEEHYGAPVDIEWAWKDAKAWLLQARPVTTVGRKAASAPPTGWSRS
jgi:phosphoenolpyruvate synthase/pyruvate phosphate dikinase